MKCNGNAKQYLPNSTWCFVCGEDNSAGLRTRFYVEDGCVKARWRAHAHHCGYENVVHGGVTASIMDECMGWAATRLLKRMCVTAELTVRYLRPLPADCDLIVAARVARPGKRVVHARASLADEAGKVYAQAEGRFVPLSVEETLAVDDQLLYRGGEERLFDALRTGCP